MITLYDMNQSWAAPEGFDFVSVKPDGAYLLVTYMYHQDGDQIVRGGMRIVTIYLESHGREVMRTVEEILDPIDEERKPEPPPVGARFKFWNGFLLALLGIQEMATCLKKSAVTK